MRCAADRKSTKNCIRLVFFFLLYNACGHMSEKSQLAYEGWWQPMVL